MWRIQCRMIFKGYHPKFLTCHWHWQGMRSSGVFRPGAPGRPVQMRTILLASRPDCDSPAFRNTIAWLAAWENGKWFNCDGSPRSSPRKREKPCRISHTTTRFQIRTNNEASPRPHGCSASDPRGSKQKQNPMLEYGELRTAVRRATGSPRNLNLHGETGNFSADKAVQIASWKFPPQLIARTFIYVTADQSSCRSLQTPTNSRSPARRALQPFPRSFQNLRSGAWAREAPRGNDKPAHGFHLRIVEYSLAKA
jgi:hypothetical protein